MTELSMVLHGVKITFPNLRLGQVIENSLPVGKDLYYVTDEELIMYLSKYVQAYGDLNT